MNLPTIETPRYTCTLPNSNIEVSYRPFLVGEQKSLLIAQEAEDNKNTIKEMYRLLDVCTDVDAYKLESLDLEFLFLKIRIVSVGETSDIGLACESCGEQNVITVNYLEHEITTPEKQVDKLLTLNENLKVELKLPNLLDMSDIQQRQNIDMKDIKEDDPKIIFDVLNGTFLLNRHLDFKLSYSGFFFDYDFSIFNHENPLDFPNSLNLSKSSICLPIGERISSQDVVYISETINNFFR